MVKCDICSSKIETTFLNKILGTTVRDANGKKKTVCNQCQRNGKVKEIRN